MVETFVFYGLPVVAILVYLMQRFGQKGRVAAGDISSTKDGGIEVKVKFDC